MGEKGWQKGSEATRWDPEPISWENFLTNNDQFQVEVVWTRSLRCKSSQLTIPSPCDHEASWWWLILEASREEAAIDTDALFLLFTMEEKRLGIWFV